MKLVRMFLFLLSALLLVSGPKLLQAAEKPDRQVAITIDDLPAGASNTMSAAEITDMTTKLLTTLRDQKVPAVGFVNEKKLYKVGEIDQRIAALRMWLDYGFELGNHTFSHPSLNQIPLRAWEDDVIHGENVIDLLLTEHHMKLRYFRHPFLDVGRDLETRRQVEQFLVQRGYRIAPVTLRSTTMLRSAEMRSCKTSW
jgi:peptidoglycan/xylan/chitin deacetylase (PgdA/CDA1 family)